MLVSNGSKTYGIFNYKKLQSNGAKTGFIDGVCNTETFLPSSISTQLTQSSNVHVTGQFINLLSSSGNIDCLPHTECYKKETEEISCRCKTCDHVEMNVICGSDHVTYLNECELKRSFCITFGADLPVNVSIAHNGDCTCENFS